MNSDIDEYLGHVDQWKFKVHNKLKRMTAAQRRAFWEQIHQDAQARGLPVAVSKEPVKPGAKRPRRTG